MFPSARIDWIIGATMAACASAFAFMASAPAFALALPMHLSIGGQPVQQIGKA
jgi:hypothetical protein